MKKASGLIGYVIGTQSRKTVKVRVPYEVFIPKYQKSIVRHKNVLAHDETESTFVGDVVRVAKTIRFSQNKQHAVCEVIKPADKYIDPDTNYVYTNGHLHIPVGLKNEDGQVQNWIPRETFRKMGLL